jgi:hypothetical protein
MSTTATDTYCDHGMPEGSYCRLCDQGINDIQGNRPARRDQRVITINGVGERGALTITEHDYPLDFRLDAPCIEICEREVCVDLDRHQARMVRDAIAFLLGPDPIATTSAY